MGVYDRDYYRNDAPGGGVFGGVAPMCKWLVGINVAVYVLQLLSLDAAGGGASDWLSLSVDAVLSRGQVWRVVTYAFCHDPDSPMHILFNMLALWIFGGQIEAIYGQREFLRFYLTGVVVSAAGYLAFGLAVPHPVGPAVGASGAVMAVTMLCALYYPTMKILVLFVIPLELRWLVVLFILWDLYPLLRELGGAGVYDQVAHAAHLGGLLYGFLYKRFDLRYSRLLPGWSLFALGRSVKARAARSRNNVRLYRPPEEERPPADLKLRVDEILAKISAQGEASLTDAEREILKEASRRYKKR